MYKKVTVVISILFLTAATILGQYCSKSEVSFNSQNHESFNSLLTSSASGDGVPVDGKPDQGSYCRIHREMECSDDTFLQGLAYVDDIGITLQKDNCSKDQLKFSFSDSLIEYRNYNSNFITVGQGIFKKCELEKVGDGKTSDMTEVFCRSTVENVDVVLSSTVNGQYNGAIYFADGRNVPSFLVDKSQDFSKLVYTSPVANFSLAFDLSSGAGGSTGLLTAKIDDTDYNVSLNCKHANPFPAIVAANDLEISSKWMDTSGLMGYWKLNGITSTNVPLAANQIQDSSGQGNHGTAVTPSAFLFYNDGPLGQSIDFAGIDDVVAIPSNATLDDMATITVSAWINPRSSGEGSFGRIVDKTGGTNPNNGWTFFVSDTTFFPAGRTIVFEVDYSTQRLHSESVAGVYNFNQWQHVAVVWNGSAIPLEVKFYVNGKQVTTTNPYDGIGTRTTDIGQPLRIGENNCCRAFDGLIDDVSVWNKELTPGEIREIYERGATGL